MKKIFYFIIVMFIVSSCTYEIIDSKPGESVNPVTNLNYTVSGSDVTLTWDLPTSYPDDIIQPVSVFIKVTKDGQAAGTFVVEDSPVTYTFTGYDEAEVYRFTVKVQANVNTDDPNLSELRYSSGNTIEI